jgi:hypothetical protein
MAISSIEAAWRRLFVGSFLRDPNFLNKVYIIMDGVHEADDEERRLLFSLAKDVQETPGQPISIWLSLDDHI